MITDMRDSVSSWPVKVLLSVLVLTFISFYGLSARGGKSTLNHGEVANVNGEPIKSADFSFQFQNLVQNYQKQGRLPQDVPEGLYAILKQQLLASMIYQKLKSSEAKHVGLVASNDEVKRIIKKQFSDPEGKFDFKFYEGYLRNQMGKTPGQYEEIQRENIRANMFEQLILETGLASNLQLKDSYRKTNEKVSLSYIRLNEKNTASIRPKAKAGTTEELKKYFDENHEEFKTKEAREMDIAYYEKSSLKSSNFEKDAQSKLQGYADKNSDIKTLASNDKELRYIPTGMVGYEDKILNLTPAETTEVLNATSNLEVGKDTILVSRDGSKVFLIKLLKSKPAELPAFETVRAQVEKSYAEHGDKKAFEEWVNASWKDIVDGKMTMEAFAKKIGSSVKDTESFATSSSGQVPEIGSNSMAMNEAFSLTKEKPFFKEPVKVDDDYVFMKLKSKVDPDWKKFETENDNLANALHKESAQTRFMSWMTAVEKNSKIKRELVTSAQGVPVAE